MSDQEESEYGGPERRVAPYPAVMNLHRRIDSQDQILFQIRDMLVSHIAEGKEQKKINAPVVKALDEIVLLWRASKILIPALVACSVGLWSLIQWGKAHLK